MKRCEVCLAYLAKIRTKGGINVCFRCHPKARAREIKGDLRKPPKHMRGEAYRKHMNTHRE
jgi:hypothetical protein